MSPGETVLVLVVGAALSSLGGLLAQLLTYRLQSRTWKRDLRKQRLEEVWRYVASGLESADWICNVRHDADGQVTTSDYQAWHEASVLIQNRLKELPVRGSAAIVTAGDAELAALLKDFVDAMDPLIADSDTISLEQHFPEEAVTHRKAAVRAAEGVYARINQLLENSR